MDKKSTFKEYYTALSASEKVALAKKAETSVIYLFHIASGSRKAGLKTLLALTAADPNITELMLRPDLFEVA